MSRRFLPFTAWLPEVNRRTLSADAMAGLIGAVVVLPQGVAFAVIAGMPPEYGLYVAMVPAAVAALFGSSRLMVSGPATPASIVLFSTLTPLAVPGSAAYVQLALTLTLMVGLIQLALGLARLGYLVNFISHAVVVGFSAGAAVLIALSQAKDFLGIELQPGLHPFRTVGAILEQLHRVDWLTLGVGVFSVAAGIAAKRLIPRVPYMLVGLVAGSLLAFVLNRFASGHVALVSAAVSHLPPLSVPLMSFSAWQQLAPAALAVTLFAVSQAVSISRTLAARTGDLVDGNQEFIGQGLSNIAGAFFSGYVSTGSFNRSGVNYEAGARTPLASVFASLLLVAALYLVAPLLGYLAKAAMAGVLFMIAASIVETAQIKVILRASRSDTVVLLLTFSATLLLSLDFAIVLGVLASLVIYLHKVSQPRVRMTAPDPRLPGRRFSTDRELAECPQAKMIHIDGALFFGATSYVGERLQRILQRNPQQKHLLILARSIGFIDVTGAELLAEEGRQRRALGGGLYFHQLSPGARGVLERGGYAAEIGADHFFESKGDAISALFGRLDRSICLHCTKRIFNECKSLPSPQAPPA